jgi:phytoene dehydrogenase-like protein
MSAEVIIIGAGLAGLTCARRLQQAGRSCVVLEAAEAVGGRVRTDAVEGFRLDRGFQVFLTAYPEARRWLDYKALDLKAFTPGALVQTAAGRQRVADPFRQPAYLWPTLRASVGTLADKLRIATLRRRARRGSLAELFQRPETSTLAALQAHGFGAGMIEQFLRPWLGGIFLERELATSSRMMEFVFRMLAEGVAAVPARGMQAIPDQLAAGLRAGTVRLNTPVASLESGGVRLASGECLRAQHVVVATDGTGAAGLLPELPMPAWRSTVTVYFEAAHSPVGEATLLLNGQAGGRVNHVAVMSDVAPKYAPAGRALIAVSLKDHAAESDSVLAGQVLAELTGWWGQSVGAWRVLKTVRVSRALPVRSPLMTEPVRPVRAGVWVCGDHRDSASIQGAMQSGRATADAIILPE